MEKEKVNHPAHYNQGNIEVIDYIVDQGWGEGFCVGNVIKYVSRHKDKGTPLEDLQKAQWYLNKLIEIEKQKTQIKNTLIRLDNDYEGYFE